jgi:uroporphyrinogen-III synthase
MAEVVDHVSALAGVASSRVALQLFDPDDHPTTAALRAVAGSIVEVPVYRWLLPDDVEPAVRLIDAAVAGSLDAITFTSQPAVHFLLRIAEGAGGGRADALRAVANAGSMLVACIGPVCAEACTEEGLHDVVWPEPFRLPPMVRLVADRIGAGGAVAPLGDQG